MTAAHDMSMAEGDRVVGRVMRHLIRCEPCQASLEGMKTRADAIAYLAGHHRNEQSPRTAVDRVFARSIEGGRIVLADLVYELAKACMLESEEIAARFESVSPTRTVEEISKHIEGTADRIELIGGEELPEVCRAAVRMAAAHVDPAATALEVLGVLRQIEGDSVRCGLVRAHALMSAGSDVDALDVAVRLVDRRGSPLAEQKFVFQAITRACVRLKDAVRGEEFTERALGMWPNDPVLGVSALYLAAMKGEERLSEVARRVRSSCQLEESRWSRSLAEGFVQYAHDSTHQPVEKLRELVGLAASGSR